MITSRRDPSLHARLTEIYPLGGSAAAGVRAGSALAWTGGRLLAVQDDAFTVVWIDPATRALEPLVLAGEGAPLTKPEKPDFEAMLVAPNGALYVLGSGSAPKRRWIAHLDPACKSARLVDAGPLYDAVAVALGVTPNIEGAVLLGDVVRLFHRGSGGSAFANASLDVPFEALFGERRSARVLSLTRYDLGAIGSVALTFTDATPLADGRIVYLAVAEDTPDAIADGPVVGGAVGVLGPNEARWAPLIEADGSACARKAEGIALDTDGRRGFLLTDPDNAQLAAELCRIALEGGW
jgi:hypothetical protein